MILSDSQESNVFTEAVCQMCSCFPDQYVILSESGQLAVPIEDELVRRSYTEQRTCNERSVSGIPWKHVNFVVQEITGRQDRTSIQLPTSTGIFCHVSEKQLNQWTDLQILASNECDRETHIVDVSEERDKKRRTEEEQFYRGHEVSWWNFWFNQVLARNIHENLKDTVKEVLRGQKGESEDDRNMRVTIYHQPGAGATTTAKNVLWDLRRTYRCAVVTNITEMTSTHILEFRRCMESNSREAKPVLILLDNTDSEKTAELITSVQQKTRETMYFEEPYKYQLKVFCAFLMCKRTFEKPKYSLSSSIILKHRLDPNEIEWFTSKQERLEKDFKNNVGPNPKHLISFNVLKENFDTDLIHQTVYHIVKDIDSRKEKLMLKYLAFLNTYDYHHQPVPLAAFDNMMIMEMSQRKSEERGRGFGRHMLVGVANHWEVRLSCPTKILVDESYRNTLGKVRTIGIIHPVLSKELLDVLSYDVDGKKQSLCTVASEFLNCREIFDSISQAKEEILKILVNIINKRDKNIDRRLQKFSPLINEITEESPEKALEVFTKVYDLTEDKYVAQQIARYYIHLKNWDKADHFARVAAETKPESSVLYDTYAQVFKGKLIDYYNEIVRSSEPFSVTHIVPIVKCAKKAMDLFQKEQKLCDQEPHCHRSKNIGLFGQISVFVKLMECMAHLDFLQEEYEDNSKDTLRKFLAEPSFNLDQLSPLQNVEGTDYIQILKNMWERARGILNHLEDEIVQLRETYTDEQTNAQRVTDRNQLVILKLKLDSFIGEYDDVIPADLKTQEELCDFRRRRVSTKAGYSFSQFLSMAQELDGDTQLLKLYKMLHENVLSNCVTTQDYQSILMIIFSMLQFSGKHLHKFEFSEVVEWSRKLYGTRDQLKTPTLEPYMFYTMLNWPRLNTEHGVSPVQITEVLKLWKSAYNKKYPHQRDVYRRKKDAVKFFFANGSGLASITTYEDIKSQSHGHPGSESFWRAPYVLRMLHRFKGTLNRDGNLVSIQLKHEGNSHIIDVQTSLPIRDPNKLNKTVYCVIGFSWCGPKAYDVDVSDPTQNVEAVAKGHRVFQDQLDEQSWMKKADRKKMPKVKTEWNFIVEIREIRKQIKEIEKEISKCPRNRIKVRVSNFFDSLKRTGFKTWLNCKITFARF